MDNFKVRYSAFHIILVILAIVTLIATTMVHNLALISRIGYMQDSSYYINMSSIFSCIIIIALAIYLIYIATYSISVDGGYITCKTLFRSTDYSVNDITGLTEKETYRRLRNSRVRYKTDLVYYTCHTIFGSIKFNSRMSNYGLFIQYIDIALYERRKEHQEKLNNTYSSSEVFSDNSFRNTGV